MAITTRYNNTAGSLVTAHGQVIKNNGRSSTTSESLEAKQSGGKGANETSKQGLTNVNSHNDPALKNGYLVETGT